MKPFTLTLVFFLTLVAPGLASAEPPPGKGNAETPRPLAMRDANGAFMGDLVTLEFGPVVGPSLKARIVYRGDPDDAAYFETNPLILLALDKELGFAVQSSATVYFSDPNCSGTPYLAKLEFPGFPGFRVFGLPALPAKETIAGPLLFVPVDPQEPQTSAEVQSALEAGIPECANFAAAEIPDLVEASAVILDKGVRCEQRDISCGAEWLNPTCTPRLPIA